MIWMAQHIGDMEDKEVTSNKNDIIVHLWTAGPFMDESTYQETMLANSNRKHHEKVCIVTTNISYNLDGTMTMCECGQYKNNHGVEIIRLNTHRPDLTSKRDFLCIYRELLRIKPDFIMNHVFNPTSCMAVHLYKKKNPRCKVIADSHMTKCNSYGDKLTLREIVICGLMRMTGLLCYKDVDRFYGITRQTVEMMIRLYGVPADKAEYLPLGYDSGLIDLDRKSGFREEFHVSKGISNDKLVFVTGGKLSKDKKTYELVKAFKRVSDSVLLVFGDFSDPEYESRVKQEAGENIIFMGVLKQKQIYDLYLASDIAIFPGSPSCLRQEAVACGLPIIMACNEGDEDINIVVSSNGLILNKEWDEEELLASIEEIKANISEYKTIAIELAKGDYRKYSYETQAEYILNN